MPNLLDRITLDDEVCNGRPTIRGYPLTVQTIIEFVLAGTPDEELFEAYTFLEKDDIEACKQFAIRLMDRDCHLEQYETGGSAKEQLILGLQKRFRNSEPLSGH